MNRSPRNCMLLLCLTPLLTLNVVKAQEGIQVENALLKTIEATTVAAEVAGPISRVLVKEGMHVKAGELLGRIKDDAIKLKVEHSQLEVQLATKHSLDDINIQLAAKGAKVAEDEFARAAEANAKLDDTYAPKEVDRLRLIAESAALELTRAKHDLEVAKLQLAVSKNDLRQAEELLGRHAIKAPVDGVIVAVDRRIGEWVEPGSDVLQIVKIDRLRIEGFVNAAVATDGLVGRPARVTIQRGQSEHQTRGQVVFVSPDANPINGLVRVFVEIDNAKSQFRPGMRVSASIESKP